MKQGNPVQIKITALSHDGRGVAHIAGKTTFLSGALVGEEVLFEYTRRHSRFDEGKVVQVLESAAQRVNPPCVHFGTCGGCSLQHMHENDQIRYKEKVLVEQLQHMGGIRAENILPPVTSALWQYRTKARLGVRYVDKKQKLLIGFRERDGRFLADIESCAILHQSIGERIPIWRDFLLRLSNFKHIPQLEVAVGETETAIIIRHLSDFSAEDLAEIKVFAQEQQYHIYLQRGGPETAQLYWPKVPQARLSYRLQAYQIELLFHPTDFTQVHRGINEKLVTLTLELLQLKKHEVVLDLFCGIGNFSLPLARYCQQVIAVEGSQQMVERASENARHNQITNTAFYCMDLAGSLYNECIQRRFDAVLIDPPRGGAKEILQLVPTWNCQRIVYVSCNPATLARDAGYLQHWGYRLKSVGVLDMFPHTNHVESIALFEK